MLQLFPTCHEAARRISEQQDVALSITARIGLRLHLALCAHCRRYSRQITQLRSYVADYPDRLSKVRLPEQVQTEIVRRLTPLP